jgi:threonylcarbamoyladenosine tRNA methylthiotransferase MtaB
VLTGVNVGSYGNDSKRLTDVIAALNTLPGLERIRLSSVEFKTLSDGVLDQMADPKNKLVPYLHLPVQSGSDRILRSMGRHYTSTEARRFIDQVARYITDVGLGTDLMVGFPGETGEDFAASIDFLQNTALHYAHVFSYSRRGGTLADGMEGQFIGGGEIAHRSRILRRVSGEKHRYFLGQWVGRTGTVLFEDGEASGFSGLTANYIRVFVPRSGGDLANQIRPVRFLKNRGTFMEGEIILREE